MTLQKWVNDPISLGNAPIILGNAPIILGNDPYLSRVMEAPGWSVARLFLGLGTLWRPPKRIPKQKTWSQRPIGGASMIARESVSPFG